MNLSGLRPLGHSVLVKPYEFTTKLVQVPDHVKERQELLETRVVVVEAGPEAWKDEKVPRAQPGDRVMVTRYAGATVIGTADGQTYRLVNDRDMFCGIAKESAE